ncbi:polysaccharide pyruvyl transferase family protein [Oleomonas cavernae]|uniref:Polysaccharide pyruvyl transferase family protein n=1 Tax=Oleomonas cavernae TaxID=2320859 RepID=A0A418WTA0_9PROT|nr:polysaccharide pyruvyl transferase family protein [Oleomonas cavernae]RJF94502.1 polysaccharide pyruvyl transferase family protein [Oleomonas cavernae]
MAEPLKVTWVAAPHADDHLNIGDALSPVMVACVAGQPVEHAFFDAPVPRISAVGTIANLFSRGEVTVWGSGSSRYRNPGAGKDRQLFEMPADTRYRVMATRGPIAAKILERAEFIYRGVYGDPVWLLPRFYNPGIEKRYELGVIIHLSDLVDRAFEAHPDPRHLRYRVPESLQSSVKLINTVTPVSVAAMKERLDQILSCKRIVSTSLHGMVFAESYGIPCLYFSPRGGPSGLVSLSTADEHEVDLRIADLYAGLGMAQVQAYRQHRVRETDWDDLIGTIDRAWEPKPFDGDRLIEAFPGPIAPLTAQQVGSGGLFGHPLIASLPMYHVKPRKSGLARLRSWWRKR